jgi:hypothetical protein
MKFINKISTKSDNIDDDFIKRLRSLVIGEGMLCDGNIKLIDFAIKNMPNEGSVLEIGSYGGLSTNLIAHLIKKHKKNNLLFNCDAWIYEGFHDHKDINDNNIDGRNDVSRAAYSVYMKQSFFNATKFLSNNNLPHSFNMFSISFFDKWDNNETLIDMFGNSATLGGSISFAYIDGGHSYEVAWQDFTNVSKYLSTGGYILLDDSADSMSFGSSKMMSEIKKNNAFKIIDKAPNYLIQKIK